MGMKFANNAGTTLAAGVAPADLTLTVNKTQGANFPALGAGDYFYLTLQSVTTLTANEVVKVTAVAGNTFAVIRGQDGTVAQAFNLGDRAELRMCSAILNELPTSATLAASSGSSLIGWITALTGAVAATLNDWIGWRAPSPLDFMTTAQRADVINGTLALDHTAAVQAALNTGRCVDLLGYSYKVAGLVQTSAGQGLVSKGRVGQLIKNANGVLLTSSGDYFEMDSIQVVGTGYTGDNIVATGNHPRFKYCASVGAAGRALKATGGHVQIDGTCNSYTTTDAAGTGYDIEVGNSGTATLYHQFKGVYTSQATGGVLLIDTGSHDLIGGQIGKLTLQVGTGPAGVNGGNTVGVRVVGATTVGVSNASFSSNTFGDDVTLSAGVTGTSVDDSNVFAVGKDVIDNTTNLNNALSKNAYTGTVPVTARKRFGGSTSLAVLNWNPTTGNMGPDGNWQIKNGKAVQLLDASGNTIGNWVLDGSLNGTLAISTGATFGIIAAGSGGVYQAVSGTSITQAYSGGFRPNADNTLNLGTVSQRWAQLCAGTATINTSDAREKQQIRTLTDQERAVAVRAKGLLRAFKFNDAVEKKGDSARWHIGIIAQELAEAFQAEGLDPHAYAMFCYDEWDGQEEVRDADGNVISAEIPAGDRYGVRYEELLAFMLAVL